MRTERTIEATDKTVPLNAEPVRLTRFSHLAGLNTTQIRATRTANHIRRSLFTTENSRELFRFGCPSPRLERVQCRFVRLLFQADVCLVVGLGPQVELDGNFLKRQFFSHHAEQVALP